MFKRIVTAVEIVVAIGAAVFVILLFANEPGSGGGGASGNGAPTGASLFSSNCATCHGSDGSGGVGPQLSDGKSAQAFPDVADEIQVVTNGRNGMPPFGNQLSAAEISLVVEYTRTL